MSTRRLLVLLGAALGTGVLALALDAAGEPVALGVAIAALVVLVLSYGRLAVLAWRARGEQDVERVRAAARLHVPVMVAVPLVVTAGAPWGLASVAVGFGAVMLCQVLFLHVLLIVGMAVKRRSGGGHAAG